MQKVAMKRVCAWCQKVLPPKEAFASRGDVTHGICSRCAIKLTSYKPRTIQRLLNFIQEPVFVINGTGVVKAANQSGLKLLGKELKDIENELGGDALECSYAGEENGCGQTVHCKTCAIRNTVMDTLATGRGYKNVPAFQSIHTPDGTQIMKFTISTEKVGDSILLRIDEVAGGS
jgi:hypothetical protein